MKIFIISLDLCTYLKTEKSYSYQDWFYCHTCGFEDLEGVCTVCIKTCHAGHDVTFAKNSPFFCDCGAKGEKYCHGLVKNKSDKKNETKLQSALCRVKEDYGIDLNFDQVTIIDFEFKMKSKHSIEENMIARKWQLAELDSSVPEWFQISDMPYNSMWKADEFWREKFHPGQKFKSYFCYDNLGRILMYEVTPN